MDQAALPIEEREPGINLRWTLKRFVSWIAEKSGIECCRETVRKALKKLNLSWKKARKLLARADKEQRELYLEKIKLYLQQATEGERTLIYIDEAHIHLDTDEGYNWSVCGERLWVNSCSPGLKKVSFYGVYFYNEGQVKILPFERANSETTIEVIEKIALECQNQPNVTLIWDGASYHRSAAVKKAAVDSGIELIQLPAYSPDFMPVEHLWAWLREEVTYYTCYEKHSQLIDAVKSFCQQINQTPWEIADRLWTAITLDPHVENLRFSK